MPLKIEAIVPIKASLFDDPVGCDPINELENIVAFSRAPIDGAPHRSLSIEYVVEPEAADVLKLQPLFQGMKTGELIRALQEMYGGNWYLGDR